MASDGQVAHSGMAKAPTHVQVFGESGRRFVDDGLSAPNHSAVLDMRLPFKPEAVSTRRLTDALLRRKFYTYQSPASFMTSHIFTPRPLQMLSSVRIVILRSPRSMAL